MTRRPLLALATPVAALLLVATTADAGDDAPEQVLRIATVAPDGSSWARELRAFARDVKSDTRGKVQVKFYFGGMAGNELEVAGRIDRGQLDGIASGGVMCSRLMPSLDVVKLGGKFQSRDEVTHVVSQLAPAFEEEARAAGYTVLGFVGLGKKVLFARRPIESMEQLRAIKVWRWDLDRLAVATTERMGLDVLALPLEDASRAYDDELVDAFFSVPTAALAFQWFAQAPYIIDLDFEYLTGCFAVANRALDELPDDHQQIVLDRANQLMVRVDAMVSRQDQMLLGGIFQKQGLQMVPVGKKFRKEIATARRRALSAIKADLPADLMDRVDAILAAYRAERAGDADEGNAN